MNTFRLFKFLLFAHSGSIRCSQFLPCFVNAIFMENLYNYKLNDTNCIVIVSAILKWKMRMVVENVHGSHKVIRQESLNQK